MQNLITLVVILLALCTYIQAQTRIQGHPSKPIQKLEAELSIVQKQAARTGFEKIVPSQAALPESDFDIQIGQSQYDNQSNASVGSRMLFRPDGSLSAAWCQSQETMFYSDRGTGYAESEDNHVWMPDDNQRIENERTGFPSLVMDGYGIEHVFAHTEAGQILHTTKLQNDWQSTVVPHQIAPGGYWAKAAAFGNSIHLIYLTIPEANGGALVDGMDGQLLYCRSTDAGQTWDKIDVRLPDVTASKYFGIGAEEYSIDVQGSIVSITLHPKYGDILSITSRDNGDIFSSRVVQDFVFDRWDLTTVDTSLVLSLNDPMAPEPLAFLTTDGSGATLVDNDGMVHVWYSSLYVQGDDPLGNLMAAFLNYDAGIYYWNESMADNTAEIAGFAPDLDGDGIFGHPDQTDFYTEYDWSISTQPSVGIAQNGDIYLAYCAPNELDLNSANGTLYRKVFISTKSNNDTWSGFVSLNNDDNSDASLTPFQEHIYPSLVRTVTDSLFAIAHVDYTQGTNINQGNTDVSAVHYFSLPTSLPAYSPTRISGTVYVDENENGQRDIDEPPFFGATISRNGIPIATSNQDGGYLFFASQLSDTIRVIPPAYASVTPAFFVSPPNQSSTADFGLTITPGVVDGCISASASTIFRPGFETDVVASFFNAGSAQFDGVLKMALDPKLEYLSADRPPTQIVGDTLIWDLNAAAPFATERIFVSVKTIVGTPLSSTVKIPIWVQADEGDVYPSNNYYEICEEVVGSYDPNDKRCVQGAIITPQQLADTLPLEYIIRFQNTGTFQADFVRVQDTMSTNLDLASFEFLGSSHDCVVFFKEDRLVDFFFPNINLPDSTSNEPESHGFIHYRIYPKLDLKLGDAIENTAYIYFDFNPPIITNTTTTEIAEIVATWDARPVTELQISPNPSSGFVYIDVPAHNQGRISVFDTQGRLVLEKKTRGERVALDLTDFPNGSYVIQWSDAEEKKVGRFVIQH